LFIEGNLGADTIYGSTHNDVISGDEGDDLIIGGLGADNISGNEGDDLILGDLGNVRDENGNDMTRRSGIVTSVESLTGGEGDTINGNLGNDTVIGGDGADIISDDGGNDIAIGDSASITWTNSKLNSITSTFTGTGGNDTFNLNDGDKIVISGFGEDSITAGNGDNTVMGDNGKLTFNNAVLQTIETIDISSVTGGIDNITLGNGENIVMGGTHGDTIKSGTGNSILIGDNGTATFTADGKRIQVVSELSSLGGDDSITASGGANAVLGGVGKDTITTGAGSDSIFGDNGQLDYKNGILNRIATTDILDATGGIDTIDAGDGDNKVFGGTHGDVINSGVGNSILMGDNGFIQLNDAGNQRVQVISEVSTLGGDDDISARGGNNLAFGSVGDDRIETADGNDVIFGDNGIADYVNGLPDSYYTTDTTLSTSGNDQLIGGSGDDLIFGGLGNDAIYANAGNDKVVGDLGQADFKTDDSDPNTLDRVYSKNSETGGQDEVYGGEGNDVIIGGAATDNLYGEEGDDFVSGDGGLAIFNNGRIQSAETTELFIGGDDVLSGGEGNDILMGGFGDDLFYGNLSEDAMVGEYGRALLDSTQEDFANSVSLIRLGQGNLDLIASSQFGLYNDKLEGLGFTPLSKFTPLSSSALRTDAASAIFTSDGERRHQTSSEQGDILDFINNLPATAAGETDTEEGEQCFDDQGETIVCPVDDTEAPAEAADPSLIDEAVPNEQLNESESPPTEIQNSPIEPQENENKDDNEDNQESSSEADETLAAISAMVGWSLSTGNKVGMTKVDQKGFDKLSHKQRNMQRWDDKTQSFVNTNG